MSPYKGGFPVDEQCLVFNIQKFSLHDGPGIRTVVFLKGCPLRCAWCANPESQSGKIQILWDRGSCLCCGACAGTCPQGAITFDVDGVRIDHARCAGCGTCVRRCPAQALTREGEWKSVDEALRVCMQDQPFYEESGGGVTLSGGEPLMHPDFCTALLVALREKGVHTALETTGYAPADVFDRVSALAGLLLFDMKHWDETRHVEGTGVSNRPILENMRRASASGIEVLPRIPVIPGYNDAPEDADGFCRRLRELGLSRAQLLPFHQFGEKKYALLGIPYAYSGVDAIHKEDLEPFHQRFLDHGVEAFF